MRPNLGYSNYHWINVDKRKAKSFKIEKEELSEPEPIKESFVQIELEEEDEVTEFEDIDIDPVNLFPSKENLSLKIKKEEVWK